MEQTKYYISAFMPFILASAAFAQLPQANDADWVQKAKRAAQQYGVSSTAATPQRATGVSQGAAKPITAVGPALSVSSSSLSLIRVPASAKDSAGEAELAEQQTSDGEKHFKKTTPSDTATEQPKAQPQAQPQPAAVKQDKKSNINWINSSSGNFNIRIERRKDGIMTPNLAMKFETVHQVLRKNISWMIGNKIDVDVYESKESFMRNEPDVDSWAGAFFSPEENRIVMYDATDSTERMIKQFTHELTHLFVENFYNPKDKPRRLEPPIWLNEGLAVNMEDIAADYNGGVWASDLIVINIFSAGDKNTLNKLRSSGEKPVIREKNLLSKKVVFFIPFSQFMTPESYDRAEQKGDIGNWYFQAYAMVRFLFKPYNSMYPEKRMQFEQFTKLLNTFEEQKTASGVPVKDAQGRIVMKRISYDAALRQAYGYQNIAAFERDFWKWLKELQKVERERIVRKGTQ